jgi:hypothetical protein
MYISTDNVLDKVYSQPLVHLLLPIGTFVARVITVTEWCL